MSTRTSMSDRTIQYLFLAFDFGQEVVESGQVPNSKPGKVLERLEATFTEPVDPSLKKVLDDCVPEALRAQGINGCRVYLQIDKPEDTTYIYKVQIT